MPPRKRAPQKAPVAESSGIAPVRIGQREETPVEMLTVFSLDDVDYQIPGRPSVQRGLQFLRESRDPRVGFAAAVDNLALDLIGEDNLRVLEESPKVTREDLADVMTVVRQIVLGGPTVMEEAARSGNS